MKLKNAADRPSFRKLKSKTQQELRVTKNSHSEPLKKLDSEDSKSDMSGRSLGLNRQKSYTSTQNNFLDVMESDYLYHLGLTKIDSKQFKHCRYLIIGGSNDRMTNVAKKIAL